METETIIQNLIYIHAGLGGIALVSGGIALVAKKGGKLHKTSGKWFYYSMLSSAITALIVALLPNHFNPFLFSIGIFSSYFLISGYRSLKFNQKDFNITIDRFIAYAITITGMLMILYPVILYGKANIILSIFGAAGLLSGIKDRTLFKHINKAKKNWLKLHIGKMTGGYIAAVSAFFVVNQILPGIWNWFTPGIIGSIYITYWMNKVSK